MIVALRTVDSLPQECADSAAGKLVLVKLAVGDGGRHIVGRGVIGPQAGPRNHLASHLIVGPIFFELLPQPVGKAVAAKDDELPAFVADEAASQSLGEVVGET